MRIACFVSSHGFGHAARMAALLVELLKRNGAIEPIIFGQTPAWFWTNNLPESCSFELIHQKTDVGLVQKNPFFHDLSKTKIEVSKFLDFPDRDTAGVRETLEKNCVQLILADVSPLGIKVGADLGIPTVLIENFTWDWIYQDYLNREKGFEDIIDRLRKVYSKTTLRIQCAPFCEAHSGAHSVHPIFRPSTLGSSRAKRLLGINKSETFTLLTTGGICMGRDAPSSRHCQGIIVQPGNHDRIERIGNVIRIPMNFSIPFSDLVACSNLVVAKAGYGTIAECWGLKRPILAVYRRDFRESAILREFCRRNLSHQEIEFEDFMTGEWSSKGIAPPTQGQDHRPNGAEQAAELVLGFLQSSTEFSAKPIGT